MKVEKWYGYWMYAHREMPRVALDDAVTKALFARADQDGYRLDPQTVEINVNEHDHVPWTIEMRGWRRLVRLVTCRPTYTVHETDPNLIAVVADAVILETVA